MVNYKAKRKEIKMNDKVMLKDVFDGVVAELEMYQTVIIKSENIQLRQTLQQIRNNSESFQYELFKTARSKGYYIPEPKVTADEIEAAKKELLQE